MRVEFLFANFIWHLFWCFFSWIHIFGLPTYFSIYWLNFWNCSFMFSFYGLTRIKCILPFYFILRSCGFLAFSRFKGQRNRDLLLQGQLESAVFNLNPFCVSSLFVRLFWPFLKDGNISMVNLIRQTLDQTAQTQVDAFCADHGNQLKRLETISMNFNPQEWFSIFLT